MGAPVVAGGAIQINQLFDMAMYWHGLGLWGDAEG